MKEKLAWYKSTVEQIERKLAGAAAQAAQSPTGASYLILYFSISVRLLKATISYRDDHPNATRDLRVTRRAGRYGA